MSPKDILAGARLSAANLVDDLKRDLARRLRTLLLMRVSLAE
jgi:hypothetical protein